MQWPCQLLERSLSPFCVLGLLCTQDECQRHAAHADELETVRAQLVQEVNALRAALERMRVDFTESLSKSVAWRKVACTAEAMLLSLCGYAVRYILLVLPRCRVMLLV